MRRRLAAAIVALAVAVIALFGVVRGYAEVNRVESEHRASIERSADVAALMVAEAVQDQDPVTADLLLTAIDDGEQCEYVAEGQPAVVVPVGSGEASEDDLVAERTVTGGTVTVFVPRDALREEVVRALVPLASLALVLVALSGLAGWLLARRLSHPFGELAGAAESLRQGHLDTPVPPFGIEEADAIGRSLKDSAEKLRRLVRRERALGDSASHDLRTPVTALRIALEDLAHWPTTPPEVSAELTRIVHEVDRLSEAVSALVDAPTERGAVELVDVVELVRNAVPDRGARGGRPVFRVRGDQPVLTLLHTSLASEAVALLLAHASTVADSEVVVAVLDGPGYVTVQVTVEVTDEVTVEPGGASQPEGIVWDQAAGLAVRLGGRLGSSEAPDGRLTWSLVLPEATDQPAS